MDIQESEMPPLKLQEQLSKIPNLTFVGGSGRDTTQSRLMHISILLATAKTRAISPKEPARIQKAEDEDAPCDESKQAHRQSV